jgi:small subunit ribosomal protein S6
MKKYEAMIVLDTKNKDESAEQLIGNIEKEIIKVGAKVDQIDRLGKRPFPHNPRHVDHGWFVAYQIQAEPKAVAALRAVLRLNESVYQQFYLLRA